MTQKELASRIVHKHDIESNWNKATTFIPKQGEVIVYDIDDLHDYERLKIGDGVTIVTKLPFYQENVAYINTTDNETITDTETSSSSVTVDSYLSTTSTNPVQNKVITASINQLSEPLKDVELLLYLLLTLVNSYEYRPMESGLPNLSPMLRRWHINGLSYFSSKQHLV